MDVLHLVSFGHEKSVSQSVCWLTAVLFDIFFSSLTFFFGLHQHALKGCLFMNLFSVKSEDTGCFSILHSRKVFKKKINVVNRIIGNAYCFLHQEDNKNHRVAPFDSVKFIHFLCTPSTHTYIQIHMHRQPPHTHQAHKHGHTYTHRHIPAGNYQYLASADIAKMQIGCCYGFEKML